MHLAPAWEIFIQEVLETEIAVKPPCAHPVMSSLPTLSPSISITFILHRQTGLKTDPNSSNSIPENPLK